MGYHAGPGRERGRRIASPAAEDADPGLPRTAKWWFQGSGPGRLRGYRSRFGGGAERCEIETPIRLNVGLSYLTLDRSGPTLSGGEAQRIRLASQVGSELTGVLYVLDEPSIGLHQRDNMRLLSTLETRGHG